MLKSEFLKIGQKFRGLINGEEFKIVDITKGLKQEPYKTQQSPTQKNTIYIYIKDSKGRTSHTNAQTFKRLQIEPIRETKTNNQIFYGNGAKSKKVCSNCGKTTSIIKSQHPNHIWKYWGYCDHCNAPQFENKGGK